MTKKLSGFDYPYLAGMLYNTPLMIHPDKLVTIDQVFQGYLRGDIVLADATDEIDAINNQERHAIDINGLAVREGFTSEKPYVLTEGGTAVIQVIGSLIHRGSFLDALSGMTSYRSLQRRIDHAAENPAVRGIVLEVDSPGGSVSGLFELADNILAVRDSKPIWTSVNEDSFSAAYAISAATDRILGPKTSQAGSIGVIALHVDQTEFNTKRGLKVTHITAGKHKADFSPHQPLSKDALARAQAMVDETYDIFVEHVANGRELSDQAVRDTEAQVYSIREAIELGLADDVATLDDTVAELETSYSRGVSVSFNSRADRANSTEVSNMKLQVINAAGLNAESITEALKAAGYEVEFITAESIPAQSGQVVLTLDTVKTEHSQIAAALTAEGSQAERERIQGVYAAKMPGHEELIETLMFDGKTTGGDAASQILAAHKNALKKAGQNLDEDAADLDDVTQEVPDDTSSGGGDQAGGGFDLDQVKADWEANKDGCKDEYTSFDTYRSFRKAMSEGKVKLLRKTG